jgi:hypothetical protein
MHDMEKLPEAQENFAREYREEPTTSGHPISINQLIFVSKIFTVRGRRNFSETFFLLVVTHD